MRLAKLFFYLLLISIPFGTRILLYQFTNGFHEYETIFVYASDTLLVLFLAALAVHSNVLKNIRMTLKRQWPLVIFLVFALFSVFFAPSKGLAIYDFVRLVLLVLMAFAVAKILKEGIVKLETIFAIIAGSAIFQSLIGVAQFFKQASLGLGFLGEPVLGADIGGAAKIVVEGAKILRAYGTFPHPNVLAAFLLLGLLSLYYLFLVENGHSEARPKNLLRSFASLRMTSLAVGTFIILLGIVFAFSRTAWIIAILITFAVVFYYRNWKLGILASAIALIFFAAFNPYLLSRAKVSGNEPAVSYRLAYNKLGLDLIKNQPLGVGIGNQVLHSVKNGVYQKFGMDQPWQWQPIHNIYLLVASELGIGGIIAFLAFLGSLLISNFKFLISKQIPITPGRAGNYQLPITAIMLLALLLFGLVDHFLWTLQPGRLMLWLTIGILIGVKSAHRSMDRAQPSLRAVGPPGQRPKDEIRSS